MSTDSDMKSAKEVPMGPVVVVAKGEPVAAHAVVVQPVARAEPLSGAAGGQQPALLWADGLCNCFSDCTTCCASYFCLPVVTAQLYEKVKGRPGTCGKLAALLFALAILGNIIARFAQNAMLENEVDKMHHHLGEYQHGAPGAAMGWAVVSMVGAALMLAAIVITIVLLITVRKAIRSKDQIKPGCCGEADDCCVATFCQCCAVSQMMRHVLSSWYGRAPSSYQLCSPTGYTAV